MCRMKFFHQCLILSNAKQKKVAFHYDTPALSFYYGLFYLPPAGRFFNQKSTMLLRKWKVVP